MTLPLFESYREIALTRGQVALVDTDDYERISRHRWSACWSENNKSFYAVRSEMVEGKRVKIAMASEILDICPPLIADHRFHNTLDNRRFINGTPNLRIATDAQNRRNKKPYSSNTSGYKGVSFSKKQSKWVANIMIDGKFKHLGYSECKHEAAKIYDRKAYEVYGEFAYLNFPHEHVP